ncbi:hypothetical protein ACTFIU_004293 [Dictyostelium citrinum]
MSTIVNAQPGATPILDTAQCSFRSSSNFNGSTTPFNSILNYQNSNGCEAWSAAINDQNQFIVAGCEVPQTITHVAIQGRGDADQWVTGFRLRYSLNNSTWADYEGGAILQGNSDRSTIVYHKLNVPIRARSIAIHPVSWNGHISLRFEVYTERKYDCQGQNFYIDTRGDETLSNYTGDWARVTQHLTYSSVFPQVPSLGCSFTQYSCPSAVNNRFSIATNSTNSAKTGFDCNFEALAGTKVNSFKTTYVAFSRE